MKIIPRPNYLNRLIELRDTPDIKVITGVRRCGKSILTSQYIDYLRQTDPQRNIVFVNLQELENEELRDYRRLHQFVLERRLPEKNNYLIVDEVQLCADFELAINSLHAKRLFDIYLTGSNAFLLSSDLATLFTGRTLSVQVFPFSFAEYLDYFEDSGDLNDALDRYVRVGGLPGAYAYRSESDQYDYIREVYRTIVTRDLIQKYKVRNQEELSRIAEFMMDNVSNLLASGNVCDSLNRSGNGVSRKTVAKFIDYLRKAFIFYEAKRFDLKGKKYLSGNSKYYLSDLGMRYAVLGTRNMDWGRSYENLVYLELLRRGYDVYVGKLYKKEIDFVAIRQSEKLYVQVSDDISRPETLERELSPLKAIHDAYPKMLIARTRHETYDIKGIVVCDLARWLARR